MPIVGVFVLPHPPVLLPEIGKGKERSMERTSAAVRVVAQRIAGVEPESIVLLSPHAPAFADYFHIAPGNQGIGDMAQFGAPDIRFIVPYDAPLGKRIKEAAQEQGVAAGPLGEREGTLDHGTMVPLYFLRKRCKGVPVVRMGVSGLSAPCHYRLGMAISKAADQSGKRVVVVVSADLSHRLTHSAPYGFAPEGRQFDDEVQRVLSTGDFLRLLLLPGELAERAAQCGLRPLWIAAGVLDGRQVGAELLSYQGPFGVGYGVAALTPGKDDPERRILPRYEAHQAALVAEARNAEDCYQELARLALEHFVITKTAPSLPEDLPAALTDGSAGVFVSLHREGRLRGCMGTVTPITGSVAEEIVYNALVAGSMDPRFSKVEEDELGSMVYQVDVLSPPEEVDSTEDLDPALYGVIVTGDGKRGLLLPDLAGVETVEDQLDIAKKKAGILPEESFTMQRFLVTRHG